MNKHQAALVIKIDDIYPECDEAVVNEESYLSQVRSSTMLVGLVSARIKNQSDSHLKGDCHFDFVTSLLNNLRTTYL